MKGSKDFEKAEKLRSKLYQEWNNLSHEQKFKKIDEKLKFLRKAAYAGHNEAQYYLACFYEFGIHSNKRWYYVSRKKMAYWMLKSANNGFPNAIENMAILYESERGIQNFELAKKYYELYDSVMGITMGKNRKLFLEQLNKGLFVKDEDGYYSIIKNWKKHIKRSTREFSTL
jgi:hypothetical protein